jgi:hypothetical protein
MTENGHACFEGEPSRSHPHAELDAQRAINAATLNATDLTNHVPANRLQLTEPQPATIMRPFSELDRNARATAILPAPSVPPVPLRIHAQRPLNQSLASASNPQGPP